MTFNLPKTAAEIQDWPWEKFAPYYQELAGRPLDEGSLESWLGDWSRLRELLSETYNRLYVGTTVDTTDAETEQRYNDFLDHIYPPSQEAEQVLKQKLLASGLTLQGFEEPLRIMRAESELFREANLPLLAEELKLSSEYDKLVGAQTVNWEGEELTLPQLQPVYQDPDRQKRERTWRLAMGRWQADRQAISELWGKLLAMRVKLAENAGMPNYRDYRWLQLLRFAYTPEDSARFRQAILDVVVPAARRLYERRRLSLGVDSLRPWDLEVDPLARPPLRPFTAVNDLVSKVSTMFQRVDPQLGEYFDVMLRENLLDLENRRGKAPGGYCIDYPYTRRPFIFMNSVGLHDDVQTLLHEGGHAFHVFEASRLPYHHQLQVGTEFAEIASMAMEYLAAPYLPASEGGFYTPAEAARARIEHLSVSLLFWPYMAVVDGFQHWVYENPGLAADPGNCDKKWSELWDQYMVGIDWSGLEEERVSGWQRKLHIIQSPFYYVEYGMAELGAIQIWQNAMRDQAEATAAYRSGLALGCTVPLPELFKAAGARFQFDHQTLSEAVNVMESTIEELSKT